MHSAVNRRKNEGGAIAVIVAIIATALLLVAAFVVDFGLVRVDRQIDKSAADSATLAGLHALNGGDANPRPFVGVCTAMRYLHSNNARFADMTDLTGTWTDGAGTSTGNGCTDTTLRNQVCAPATSSWARFTWEGTMDGKPLTVVIQSGYLLTGTTGFSEDALPAAAADSGDSAQGCDQLAVLVTQQRKPGLGSLATASDLKTAVRSVGRVKQDSGGYAPAMLLLERDTCPVLTGGSGSGGSTIHVLGAAASDGKTQPGTIHSDSSASTLCTGGSNQNIFLGKGADGIVAYAAPVAASSNPDPTKPGQITSYAGSIGKALNYIIDTHITKTNVYAASGLNAAAPGTHGAPVGMPRVTRSPVDNRYFTGVKGAVASANSIFTTVTSAAAATSAGYAVVSNCSPPQAAINALALTATSRLYVDCAGSFQGPNNAALTINAGRVVFRGSLDPRGIHSFPNATHVYVNGVAGGAAINIANDRGFRMHTGGRTDPATGDCTTTRSSSKGILFVRNGRFSQSGTGLLQLCNTAVIMLSGRSDACIPATAGTYVVPVPAGPATPCAGVNGALGDGYLGQQGGTIDWTAPDALDVTLGSDNLPTAAAIAAWQDVNGPEDLSFWSESASGGTGSTEFRMQGSGVLKVRGVFMLPNAFPFTIGGGAAMNLINAQFIARSIALNGNGTRITMAVDPHASITLPKLVLVGLVR